MQIPANNLAPYLPAFPLPASFQIKLHEADGTFDGIITGPEVTILIEQNLVSGRGSYTKLKYLVMDGSGLAIPSALAIADRIRERAGGGTMASRTYMVFRVQTALGTTILYQHWRNGSWTRTELQASFVQRQREAKQRVREFERRQDRDRDDRLDPQDRDPQSSREFEREAGCPQLTPFCGVTDPVACPGLDSTAVAPV